MSFFIASAHAQAQGAANPQDQWFSMGFLILMFAVFYFIAIRPQRKRQKEHAAMVTALQKGDEVVTTSGILGKVVRIDDDYVALKVAENVELKFQKMAVHAVLPKGSIKSV
jgi:preprotein translocase subunit YajC